MLLTMPKVVLEMIPLCFQHIFPTTVTGCSKIIFGNVNVQMLGLLARSRRMVRDYEHLTETSDVFIYILMLRIDLRRLAHT